MMKMQMQLQLHASVLHDEDATATVGCHFADVVSAVVARHGPQVSRLYE